MSRILMLMSVGLTIALATALPAAAEQVAISFDLSARGKTIADKFSDMNMWEVDRMWTEQAAEQPQDYFAANFPFVRRIQLMAATGGNEQRDLFKNPLDPITLTDYDFTRLIKACDNILAMGLKPMIKTGWVPLKLSAAPYISRAFRTNVRPPADYDAYYGYIKAIAEALKQHFGVAELKTWSWGVGVEYDNRGWFQADDGKPETTRLAYFRLYDTTVAALEDVLGPENVTIGAHSMSVQAGSWGFWDPRDFIEHCARGESFRRPGRKGAHLDYLAISYYTRTPGFNPDQFLSAIASVRDTARQLGLTNLKYGVDEGRVLDGPDRKVLIARECEHPIQAAGDAKLFHLMVDHDVDYFSTWGVTTDELFGDVPIVGANLRNLAFRMNGGALLGSERSGRPAESADDVGGLAGYDTATKTLRVLLYNFNRNPGAASSEDLALSITHVRTGRTDGATLRSWPLDEDHGNWWKAWQADVAARKLPPEAFRHTTWTLSLPRELTNPADVEFWKSRAPEYAKLARLQSADEPLPAAEGDRISWKAQLKPNGVILYELFPVEPAERPGPAAIRE